MAFSIQLEYTIGAPAEFVFDWWTDLSPDDTQLATPLKRREILSKSETLIVLRDEEEMYWRRMTFDVKVHLNRASLSWTAEYDGRASSARSEYKLVPINLKRTSLFYNSRISPTGRITRFFSPIVSPLVKRVFKSEMDGFAKKIEDEYQRSSQTTMQLG